MCFHQSRRLSKTLFIISYIIIVSFIRKVYLTYLITIFSKRGMYSIGRGYYGNLLITLSHDLVHKISPTSDINLYISALIHWTLGVM